MVALLDLRSVRYSYPGAAVASLDDVTLALDHGLHVVAGPSGGGKSTLLRLCNGLVPHLYGGRIGGSALVAGQDVLRTPTRRLATTVGFVVQDVERQAVHTTVERDIAFGLENLATPRREMHARVGEVLQRLRIEHLRDRRIASLSGGERQRVALAGALVLRPRLLVLDEPLSQLDAAGALILLEILAELRDAGTTVLLAEHRLDDILPLADSLLVVREGHCSPPAPPVAAAASLDSAPQIVRLSVAMGWEPVFLDPGRAPLPHSLALGTPHPARATEPAVWTLEGVSSERAGFRGVDLAGHPGEVLALVGANGSGKTTLLRLIAGLERPAAGAVHRSDGRVAYLPQNPAALLHRETVATEMAWTTRGLPADGSDTDLLALLGLTELVDRDPRDLSSGERQRAAVAAILAGKPVVALLDEPTRGMDGRARASLVRAVRHLCARGSSVVIATHDPDLAAEVADRVLVVASGQVVDAGDPAHALSGAHEPATQLGRCFASPAPVTVAAVVAALRPQEVTR